MIEFKGFPKIPRFNRDIIITEKIDGTNAGIYFSDDMSPIVLNSGREVPFLCASRSRWIFPENDNHGFARWAYAQDLNEWMKLGPGIHHGEWWGQGIQRNYGLKEKRFSLFNTSRWGCPRVARRMACPDCHYPYSEAMVDTDFSIPHKPMPPAHCHVVPVLYQGLMITEEQLPADDYEEGGMIIYGNQYIALDRLKNYGSIAAPGFMKPEGIVIYHTAGGHSYKITLENDNKPKGAVNA